MNRDIELARAALVAVLEDPKIDASEIVRDIWEALAPRLLSDGALTGPNVRRVAEILEEWHIHPCFPPDEVVEAFERDEQRADKFERRMGP